jgi:hypothetical protein
MEKMPDQQSLDTMPVDLVPVVSTVSSDWRSGVPLITSSLATCRAKAVWGFRVIH